MFTFFPVAVQREEIATEDAMIGSLKKWLHRRLIGLQVTQKNVRMITGLGFHFSLLS